MKVNENVVPIEIEGNVQVSGSASIANEDIAMAYSIVSEGFYSNLAGSIVREVTSNCVDSHTEAGVDDPVELKFWNEEGIDFISFIDVGLGMSQDFFVNTFMSYFKSTKRESNAYYGAFGIGSKSPLGYQESYEVITTKDGIKSHYMISRAIEGPPTFDLLATKEVPFDRNGTEVKVMINPGDKNLFIDSIREQLRYFDNVIVTGVYFDNEYHILENDVFKYRCNYFGNTSINDDIHIAVGRVTYPIDFKRLGLDVINCPIGIKFNIGELIITKNRENLRYDSEDCNSLIKERIEVALKSLSELYNRQANESLSLKDYIRYQREPTKAILLGKAKYGDDINLDLPYKFSSGGKKTYLVKNTIEPTYMPLKGMNVMIPTDPFFMYEVKKWFDDTNRRNFNETITSVWALIGNPKFKLIRFGKKDVEDNKKNKYIHWSLNRNEKYKTGLVVPVERGKKIDRWRTYNYNLGLTNEEALKDNNSKQVYFNRIFNRKSTQSIPNISNGLNKTKRIIAYNKAMRKEIIEMLPSYKDFNISQEYLAHVKSLRSERQTYNNDTFKIYCLRNGDIIQNSKDVLKNTSLVVYGFKGDITKLRVIENVIKLGVIGNNVEDSHLIKRHVKLVIIPKKALRFYEANPQSLSMSEFLTNGNSVFRRAITNYKVSNFLKDTKEFPYLLRLLYTLNTNIYRSLQDLQKIVPYEDRRIVGDLEDSFMNNFVLECIDLMDKNDWWVKERVDKMEFVQNWLKDLNLLKFVKEEAAENKEVTKELIEYLKFKKKKLDAVHYFKVGDEEEFIIKFFLDKIKYLERVNEDRVKGYSLKPVTINYINTYNHGS